MRSTSLFLAGAVAVGLAGASAVQAQEDNILVGYQLPLTGSTAQYGQDFQAAAEIALKKFNASDRIPVDVEIIYEDSRSEAREGINIARKFVDNEDIVAVLGDFTSTVSMASAQVYAQAGMPQLSQTASHPDYTKVSEYQFRNITTQAQEGPYNAEWLLSEGVETVAVIAEQTDWGQSVVSNFVEAFEEGGGEVVFSEFFNRGLADFRSIITKIERANPDAVYTGFFYEDAAQFLRQVNQLGVDIPVYSTSAAYNDALIELAGEDAEGLRLTATFLPTSKEPHVQEFVAAWQEKVGGLPGQFPAQAYDAVNILLDAIARAYPDVTRETVRDELAKTKNFPGVTGTTTFDPETREPDKELVKATVKDGEFVPVEG